MPEIIPVRDVADKILMTQRVVRESRYFDLVGKAKKDLFTPDPPIILSRMPTEYSGRYQFHLYHGTHRFVVAQQGDKNLNGLVIGTAAEVPEQEALRRSLGKIQGPDERLTEGLKILLEETSHPTRIQTASMSLSQLLEELQHQENQGQLPTGLNGLSLLLD